VTDLDPDLMAAIICAVPSLGAPLTFAGCIGGSFTIAEIERCLDVGASAERGCFGEGNVVEAYLREIGVDPKSLLEDR
jgi:hypothetical protein